MKTYNVQNRLSKAAKQELERIIDTHEKYKKAYFFSPGGNANQRRSNEERFERENPDVGFNTSKGLVTVSMSYSESAQNVYYKLYVKLDGEYKDIRTVKKILDKKL